MTGEPFHLSLLKYIFKNFDFNKLFNCYGGTEMSNWVYYHDCKKNDLINYKNLILYLLEKNLDQLSQKCKKCT